jgi:hypothetical protein
MKCKVRNANLNDLENLVEFIVAEAFDNSYSKTDLDMSYIPIEQTIKEHFQQILDDGLLSKT